MLPPLLLLQLLSTSHADHGRRLIGSFGTEAFLMRGMQYVCHSNACTHGFACVRPTALPTTPNKPKTHQHSNHTIPTIIQQGSRTVTCYPGTGPACPWKTYILISHPRTNTIRFGVETREARTRQMPICSVSCADLQAMTVPSAPKQHKQACIQHMHACNALSQAKS
jgi:hypothetical protein